jgi:hypothetical protein
MFAEDISLTIPAILLSGTDVVICPELNDEAKIIIIAIKKG